ncbi:uncharacterized protein LOC126739359 [Anthonomus grandis grandis]|uniref:uncharacterized protein LOC126739359 n=1 Tax=Anthonomus grandis grandis TaxID=2921223 RepID=UPI002165E77F|nr:uncharacterized protein LOC126739359 [Anthonomus grandis grandis]
MKLKSDCSSTTITEKLTNLHETFTKQGLSNEDLYKIALSSRIKPKSSRRFLYIISFIILLISNLYMPICLDILLGIRCVVPNNYFIWEGTRPISDCSFCSNVTGPIELHNVTRKEFEPYAYSSHPIVVRQAFLHWPALKKFSWHFFKELYYSIEDSYKSVDEECQFLHFKSDFVSLKNVFSMSIDRVNNLPGEKSWYVGWGNCHPIILEEMRKYYPKPHFLPEDAEIPHKDYVFMGYDDGATMHLDFINRLMWQAQLQGSKIWKLLPPPECQNVCQPLQFLVHPGDGVLVDTRIWYHGTTIPNGEFSLSIQSEYG